MINRVHAPTKVNDYTKYIWKGSVKHCGLYNGNEGGTDGRTGDAGHDNILRPEWAGEKVAQNWMAYWWWQRSETKQRELDQNWTGAASTGPIAD